MNKKAQGMSISTIILLILGLVILVILILGFTLGWKQLAPWIEGTQYKITREVCHTEQEPVGAYYLNDLIETDCPKNITLSGKCYLTNDKQFMVNVEVDTNNFYGGGTLNYTWYSLNYSYNVSKIKEVCEQQEADSVIIPYTCRDLSGNYSWDCPDEIPKKYLTRNWLDKNCECLEMPCARTYKPYVTDEGEQVCYKQRIINCFNSSFSKFCQGKNKVGECSKYLCGNYNVEEIQ